MAASGAAAGSGRDGVRAALAAGDGGASEPAMQELVDAITVLGHLPSQSTSSSTEEKRLAARLVKERQAGTLTSQQEAQLRNLKPATGAEGHTGSGALAASGGAAGSHGAASQTAMQELVDAIIVLGHPPSQSRSSSTEENRLALRLIRARKAGTVTSQQEAQLGETPAGDDDGELHRALGISARTQYYE